MRRRRLAFPSRTGVIVGLGLGLATALINVALVMSVTRTTIAHAFVIIAGAPMVTALTARVALGEHIHLRTWAAGAVVLLGQILVFRNSLSVGHLDGDLWALLGTASIAVMFTVIRRYPVMDPMPALTAGGALTLLMALPFASNWLIPHQSLLAAAADAILVIPVAMVLITRGPRYLLASEVSLLVLLETVLAPLWAWLAFQEVPTAQTWLGASIVLSALGGHSLLDWRADRRAALEGSAQGVPQLPKGLP